jgi:hypothetical protein
MVLPLHNAILLRGVWSGEFKLDAFFIKELFNLSVPKLLSVVTSYVPDLELELILNFSNELFHNSLCFTLSCKKNTQVKWEKSSTITKPYLLAPMLM